MASTLVGLSGGALVGLGELMLSVNRGKGVRMDLNYAVLPSKVVPQ
jgi:hypothetical protein